MRVTPPHPRTSARSRLRPVAVAVALALALPLLLSACTPARPDDPIAAARQLNGATAAIKNGNAQDSCGEFRLGQGEQVPDSALDCLADAAGVTPAELAWSFPTTEGDPIVSFAFVGPTFRGVQVITTTAYDAYGGGGTTWSGVSCDDPRDAQGGGVCDPMAIN